jgi:hypothetical protein
MQNFFDMDRYYGAEGGVYKVDGPEGIRPALDALIHDDARRRAIGSKGRQLLERGRGGSEETYGAIFGRSGIVDGSAGASVGHGADAGGGQAGR